MAQLSAIHHNSHVMHMILAALGKFSSLPGLHKMQQVDSRGVNSAHQIYPGRSFGVKFGSTPKAQVSAFIMFSVATHCGAAIYEDWKIVNIASIVFDWTDSVKLIESIQAIYNNGLLVECPPMARDFRFGLVPLPSTYLEFELTT